MAPGDIDEAFVRRAAALQGLELTAAQVPGVIANLQRSRAPHEVFVDVAGRRGKSHVQAFSRSR